MADYFRHNVGMLWAEDYKFLPYKKKVIDQYQLALYVEQGYTYVKSFNGQRYEHSTMPHWCKSLGGIFGMFQQEFSFYKICTLDISPPSLLSVNDYCKKYETNKHDVLHSLLMLEDWQPGQYLEIDGEAIVNWAQGDWFQWKASVPFAYSNVGTENWYCCKIIGKTTYTGQLQELFPFNIPHIHDSGTASHPLIQLTILPLINPHNDRDIRSFVYMHNGPITRLKKLNHAPETIQEINNDGLHFYMFEPLCEYYWNGKVYEQSINNDQQVHTQGYYSEFAHPTRYEDLRAEELDSILEYKQRNGIADGVIQVHTGEYNIAETMPHYSKELTLLCDDLYLKTQGAVEDLVVDTDFQFTKHFMSLNWRYTKHRQLVANFLAGENGHLSWYFKNTFDMLSNDLYFDLDEWETTHSDLYKQLRINNQNVIQNSPYVVDKHSTIAKDVITPHAVDFWPGVENYDVGQTPSLLNAKTKSLQDFYRDIFVDIVTETRFAQPQGNFSEKLLQSVQYMKPFILLAPPHTLEYFKSFGYQTFSDFWDESYDDIEDHGERLARIFTVIKDLLNKPIEELREVYKEMMPILKHNNKLFIEKHAKPNYRNTTV
jgi:hypothetical protein